MKSRSSDALTQQHVALQQAQALLQKKPDAHIVLVRLSALGDVVLWIAVVQSILRAYPQAKMTWVTSTAVFPLLRDLPGVDFIVLKKKSPLPSLYLYYKTFAKKNFDILLAGQASWRANLIYPFIKAKLKLGFSGIHARDGHAFFVRHGVSAEEEHLFDSFMRFAKALGVPDVTPNWQLPLAPSDVQWAQKQLADDGQMDTLTGPWIAINPAASKEERNWSITGYVGVMEALREKHQARFVLTGGPSLKEKTMAEKICESFAGDVLDLVGRTSMKQLAALLGEVKLLIAPDTGPLHIATAMKTPSVGLHAVVSAKKSGSYSYQELAIDHYEEAVRLFLKRDPQTTPWGLRVHDLRAMDLITVAEVIAKAELALAEKDIEKN